MRLPKGLVFLVLLYLFLTWKAVSRLGEVEVEPSLSLFHREHNKKISKSTELYHENHVIVNGKPVHYRIPTQRMPSKSEAVNQLALLVGVLSTPSSHGIRDTIRNTWGQFTNGNEGNQTNPSTTLLFLVAGSWENISREFETFQDLLWVNCTESYRAIVWKVMSLLGIAQKHFPLHHLLKTDDDSYVRVHELDKLLRNGTGPYWGKCPQGQGLQVFRADDRNLTEETAKYVVSRSEMPENVYPIYAQGAGYILAPRLLTCLVRASQNEMLPVLPVEDATVGLFVRTCRATCMDGKVRYNPRRDPKSLIVHHVKYNGNEKLRYSMHYFHKYYQSSPSTINGRRRGFFDWQTLIEERRGHKAHVIRSHKVHKTANSSKTSWIQNLPRREKSKLLPKVVNMGGHSRFARPRANQDIHGEDSKITVLSPSRNDS